jgi:hypothetical protein
VRARSIRESCERLDAMPQDEFDENDMYDAIDVPK